MNASGALEFTDIGKLVKGQDLMIMLVPAQLDRVVFAHPDNSALAVSSGYTGTPPLQEVPTYTTSTSAPATDTSSSTAGAGTFIPPAISTAPAAEPPLPAPLPTQAPATGTSRRVLPAARPVAVPTGLPLSPQAARLIVGAATLASIAAFAAMVLLGPRMNPAAPGAEAAAGVRGIGRFARPRTGPPPRVW
jgi:hypothetical protein